GLMHLRIAEFQKEKIARERETDEIRQLPLFAQEKKAVEVFIGDFTKDFLKKAITNADEIYNLTADEYEMFICDRLYRMGFEVERTTKHANIPDGGIDIIAWSEKTPLPGLVAVQAKHHAASNHKVDVSDTREFMG